MSYDNQRDSALRIVSWNVNSWTSTNSNLRKQLLEHVKPDIIFIIESKLKGEDVIHFPGYKWYGLNRKNQLKSSKCGSGGVGIFIKNTLFNKWNFREIDSSVDGLFVTSLYNETTDSKIVLVPCYIPPENSAWSMDCEYVYNHLTSVLFSLEDVDFIILGGDFNAKIGDKVDFIPDIDVIPE